MSVFSVEIFLVVFALALLCLEALVPTIHRRTLSALSIGGVALAFVLFLFASKATADLPAFVQPYHQLDSLAVFYKGFALIITLLVLWLTVESSTYLTRFVPGGNYSELFSLPLIVCAGMMWMASAKDLVTVFVSLELVTISFYVLVAFARKNGLALEAGVKYLILGALSTGVLVYGIAWVYGATGSMSFEGISAALASGSISKKAVLLGAAFLLAGLGFKVAAAPFQMWVPDVYQGAPIPVTTFLSVGSKAAGFIVLTRAVAAFTAPGSIIATEVQHLLIIGGSLTILLGSLPAIFQTSVKRLLGYSSISHAGYLLLALGAGSARFDLNSGGVVAFYLATYLPMTVLGFLVLALLRANGSGEDLRDFRGLAKRSPLLALLMTLALASLAGLPLTAGFMGKLFVFLGLMDQAAWGALLCAVIGAAAGFYYYFRAILAMYSSDAQSSANALNVSMGAKAGAIVLAVVIVVVGVYPKPLQKLLTPAPVAVASH
ncbi:NADH-quinone oxidoreductase subunit N [Prosthecobacter debontii]|uniref:NADH-quinone oxidoreductase subunit N n=1 Tax=Prosthecobacter debontii TaxID=48467 RepID=A0A1T4YA15_9BACT|nr:NADH-quinone oxidoreductase subunit N [Prosthecobacter debontii]SKA98652.1 NADH-quinone oxidoreductase subunit N [Prosthecobacter debontii]